MKKMIHYKEKELIGSIVAAIFEQIKDTKEIVIFNIGTDRSTGDSVGPIVGTILTLRGCDVKIYGTLKDPIHAKNLEETIAEIKELHKNAFIIAIDACLGSLENIGKIIIKDEPIKPGAAMDKNLPSIGNIGIAGVVNQSGALEFMVLQNTRLYIAYEIAFTIVDIIMNVVSEYNKHKAIEKARENAIVGEVAKELS